jgi:uncharacterized repeat protein (TIGR03806 family)
LTKVTARPAADLTDRITYGGEQGLLDMAFHPGFPDNGRVYVSYTGTRGDSVLAEFPSSSDGYSADTSRESILLEVVQPYANHNGGQVAFGPSDGFLYWSLGDGGSGGDPENNGQDPHTLLGSILRLDVDGGTPYVIPSDNPFYGSPCGQGGGCPEIYAWGLRNPWRFSLDPGSGRLFAGDVGQGSWEEIDLIRPGSNYGWHCYEGSHEYDTTGCTGIYTGPVHEYAHESGRCSVTGGYVYRGPSLGGLYGHYLFADYCTGEVWGLSQTDGSWMPNLLADSAIRIAAFGRGNDGEVYALDLAGGGIYRLAPSRDTGQGFPRLLSDTGYFQDGIPLEPVSCFVPYDVAAPLWSDGAEKRRFVWTPKQSVEIDASGDFLFAPGTVFIKEFRLNGRTVETRLFMRHADGGWAGYTYEWNDAGTDAELLSDGKSANVGGREWIFPSRNGCLRCHTEAAGRALGPRIGQLDNAFDYGGTVGRVNQLEHWDNEGLFAQGLPAAPAGLTVFADPADKSAEIAARARSYLHSNCSNCHQPAGMARGDADFRHGIPLSGMGICKIAPTLSDMGIAEARLFAPGDPGRSILLQRMATRNQYQMPPLASNRIDPLGTSLLKEWILGVSACSPVIAPLLLLMED